MKLEWGKKVCCPSCSERFYDLQRSGLVCPGCGYKFTRSELVQTKGGGFIADDELDLEDKSIITDFEFEEEPIDIDLTDDADELSVKTELEEIKLVDEE